MELGIRSNARLKRTRQILPNTVLKDAIKDNLKNPSEKLTNIAEVPQFAARKDPLLIDDKSVLRPLQSRLKIYDLSPS